MAVFVRVRSPTCWFDSMPSRPSLCGEPNLAGHNFFQAEWFGSIAASRQARHAIFHGVPAVRNSTQEHWVGRRANRARTSSPVISGA